MTTNKNNLENAINEGKINLTKKLLESGASVPKQYLNKNVDSLRLLITKPSDLGRGIFSKKSDKSIAQLDEKTAESIARTLAQVNNFDIALSEALNGGFIASKTVDIDEAKNDIVITKKQTDMLRGRRKLAALMLNHSASEDENRIDLLSRFSSLKESVPVTHEKKEEWKQTYNLMIKHIELGKEFSPINTTKNPATNDDLSLTNSTVSSLSFASILEKDPNRSASEAALVVRKLAEIVGEPNANRKLESILRRSESYSSKESKER